MELAEGTLSLVEELCWTMKAYQLKEYHTFWKLEPWYPWAIVDPVTPGLEEIDVDPNDWIEVIIRCAECWTEDCSSPRFSCVEALGGWGEGERLWGLLKVFLNHFSGRSRNVLEDGLEACDCPSVMSVRGTLRAKARIEEGTKKGRLAVAQHRHRHRPFDGSVEI